VRGGRGLLKLFGMGFHGEQIYKGSGRRIIYGNNILAFWNRIVATIHICSKTTIDAQIMLRTTNNRIEA
jgi:hypothetical protein